MTLRNKLSTKQSMIQKQHSAIKRLKKLMRNSRDFISSLLFPQRCPVCDEILSPEETDKGIHLACESKLYPVEGAVCMHCGRPLGPYNPRNRQKKRMKNKEQKEYVNVDTDFDFDRIIPSHLSVESTHEYCSECRRKKYVSEANPIKYSETQIHHNHDMHYNHGIHNNRGIHGKSISWITQAKSLYIYRGAIKNTMYRFKYANKREYATFFARKAVEKYPDWLGLVSNNRQIPVPYFDVIIPVPMYLPKQKQRGYNQAESFAIELYNLTGIPVDHACIKRVKDTTPQKNLNPIERKNNLENAFQITQSIVQYKHILLVDDIYTTGYTAEAVAKELGKKGECQIYLLSICIGGVN